MRLTITSFYVVIALAVGMGTASAAVQFSDVFVGEAEGPTGEPYYRIPALAVAPNGDLLAFAEARPDSKDPGETSVLNYLVYKRSTNGGGNWSPFSVLVRSSQYNYSDPRAVVVVDAATSTSKLMIHYTQWPKNVVSGQVPPGLNPESTVAYYRTSANNGQTWSDPVNMNAQVKDPAWAQLDTGPGTGIQLRWQSDPARNGRIVIPGWVRNTTDPSTSYKDASLYSDDYGVNWNHSAASTVYGDENQIVELTNGNLLMEGRPASGIYRTRWISTDGGATWGEGYAGDVPVSVLNCGLMRYSAKRAGDDRDRILFSGPLGYVSPSEPPSGAGMSNLSIWTSYDEGKTFINPVQIASGFCCYSAMEKLHDGSIAAIYESGPSYPAISQIRLAKFALADLEGQNVSAQLTHYDDFGNNIDRKRGGIGWSGSWQGTAIATSDYRAELGGKGLSFTGYRFPTADGRMNLTPGHNTAERQLATPIDLNANSTAYVSLLISQALDTVPLADKPLDIQLRDSSEVSRAAFGVNGSGEFYVDALGNNVHTTAALDGRATYLLVLKIVSQNASQPSNFDQLYLKVFKSGADAIPKSDADIDWTLVGSAGVNSRAILDRIALMGGPTATWSFDEVRIGDTFGAVASNVHAPEPGSLVLLLSVSPVLLMFRLCRR